MFLNPSLLLNKIAVTGASHALLQFPPPLGARGTSRLGALPAPSQIRDATRAILKPPNYTFSHNPPLSFLQTTETAVCCPVSVD